SIRDTSQKKLVYFFFFFQAEDGIRDFHVTGVQTCALPIYLKVFQSRAAGLEQEAREARAALAAAQADADGLGDGPDDADDPEAAADHAEKRSAAQGLVQSRSGVLQEIIGRANLLAEEATNS